MDEVAGENGDSLNRQFFYRFSLNRGERNRGWSKKRCGTKDSSEMEDHSIFSTSRDRELFTRG